MLRAGWEKDYQGRPPVHAVAGAGEIIQAEVLADGRYNILLDGRARVRILAEEPPDGRLYRVARAERIEDRGPSPERPDVRGSGSRSCGRPTRGS